MLGASTEKERTSSCLRLLYGKNYEELLGNISTGFIGFEQEKGNRNLIIVRVVTLFALMTNFTMALINNPIIYLAVYLTNWALLSSLLLVLLIFKCSLDPHTKAKKKWLAATHIMFELSIVINGVVVPVYWLTIHSDAIKQYEDNFLVWFHQYLVHIFPATAVFVTFLTTDLKIKAGHAKIFPIISIHFGGVNFYHVKQTGVPTYWFLTWEDYMSPLVIISFTSIVTLFFLGLAKTTETLKSSRKSD